MPKRRPAPKVHSPEEKRAILDEVQRRNRQEGRPVRQLALELGITENTYYSWLRRSVAAVPPEPVPAPSHLAPGERYDDAARKTVLAEIARRLAAGETAQAACRAVKIAETTYRRWLRQAAPAPEFRAVAIAESPSLALVPAPPLALSLVAARPAVPPTAPAALSLSAPGGYRVEGLTVESAAALLRALA